MAGTKTGGAKTAITNKSKYGSDFYAKIGSIGGKKSRRGGFYDRRPWYKKMLRAKNPHAQQAGKLGGQISKRSKNATN